MDVKTYRAGSLQEALNRVREELGPDAAVLRTREVRGGWLGFGRREIEVEASADVHVPSRLPPRDEDQNASRERPESNVRRTRPTAATESEFLLGATSHAAPATPPLLDDARAAFRARLRLWEGEPSEVAELCGEGPRGRRGLDHVRHEADADVAGAREFAPTPSSDPAVRQAAEELVNELIAAEFSSDVARTLVETAQDELRDVADDVATARNTQPLREFVLQQLERELSVTGPIPIQAGRRRTVALVGPTGVGKTTTVAKLAAQYRLRESCSVGLVTVDTYRIAAVEQLRTYADILDLPLEVVSSPKEMGLALRRLSRCDLVLIDTAGRGPRDDVRLHELRAYLHEARADEVHLVSASGASPSQLALASERFAVAGVTAVLLTKLDEAPALGSLYPWLSRLGLPLSYLANGQNVPQDLEVAEVGRFARRLLQLP